MRVRDGDPRSLVVLTVVDGDDRDPDPRIGIEDVHSRRGERQVIELSRGESERRQGVLRGGEQTAWIERPRYERRVRELEVAVKVAREDEACLA